MNNIWQIVLDVVVLAVVAFIVATAIKQGFVKSLFKCTKMIIVVLLTAIFGSYLAGFCSEHIVSRVIDGRVTDMLVAKVEQGKEIADFDDLTKDVPTVIKNITPMQKVEEYFNSLSGTEVEKATKLGNKIEDVSIGILSRVLSYILSFVAIFLFCSVAMFLVEKFFEFPILNTINKIAGCIWGLSSAYIVVSIGLFFAALIFGSDFIDGTYLTKFFYRFGLFTM